MMRRLFVLLVLIVTATTGAAALTACASKTAEAS